MAQKDNKGIYPRVTSPTPNLNNLFGSGYIDVDGYSYPVLIMKPPTTVTIYNTSTTDANWTAVQTGLSGVYAWRLSEKTGSEFYYAYVASPTTYCTAFGLLDRTTALSAIYVKRTTTANIHLQLEVWTK